MKAFAWVLAMAAIAGVVWSIMRWRRQLTDREKASEQRFAAFMAQVQPPAAAPVLAPALGAAPAVAMTAAPAPTAPQERLLLEAAAKAGQAGEPVLAIQLYAKLLSRYPQSALAAQARAAVVEQKKRLPKP